MSDSPPRLDDLRRFRYIGERLQSAKRQSYRSLARASGGRHSYYGLTRTVFRLEAAYQLQLLLPGPDGGLKLTPDGLRVFEMACGVTRAVLNTFPDQGLTIHLDNDLSAHLFPGVFAKLMPTWAGKVRVTLQRLRYIRIRQQLIKGLSLPGFPSAGIGWDRLPDTEQSWVFRLRPPIRSVLIAPADRCGFTHRGELSLVATGLEPAQVLILPGREQRPPQLPPLLQGVDESRILVSMDTQATLNLVCRGVGAAVVPFWPGAIEPLAEKRRDGIRYAFLPPSANQHVTCYLPPDSEPRAEVVELIAALRQELLDLFPGLAPSPEPPPRPPSPRSSSDTTFGRRPVREDPDTRVDSDR